jgi:hypothetical protein
MSLPEGRTPKEAFERACTAWRAIDRAARGRLIQTGRRVALIEHPLIELCSESRRCVEN